MERSRLLCHGGLRMAPWRLVLKIIVYNDAVEEHLTNKFGKDFWAKFNAQLDSIDNAN